MQASADAELYIVQYITQGVEPWRQEIRSLGGKDHRFLAWHANIWRMDGATADAVGELPFVRWVGRFHPAYKLEDELYEEWLSETLEPRRYRLVVGEWGIREKEILAEQVREIGGSVDRLIPEGWVLDATLSPVQLSLLVRADEVLGVERWSPPENDMNIVRNLFGADYVESVAGYDGTGVRAEVMDNGLDTGRSEWKYAPILHGAVTAGDHAISSYSVMFANTATNTRGMVPDAQGIMADYGSYGGNRYQHTAELLQAPYNAVLQTNSWGRLRTTAYTSISQELDDILYINDIVITQSQSNAGSQDSCPQAWAKNIVSVGGIYHEDNTNTADDSWNGGASTGPAADGRVKPDLAGFYDSIATVNDPSYCCTSAATPQVAGALALQFEMWHDGIFGNTPGATVFDSRPHSTLSHALLINSAWQWPDNQADITRFRQGWGRPDLQQLYDDRNNLFLVDETDFLANLQSTSYSLDVSAGTPELRATLVYMDRAGTTSSTLHRINDLSLRLTSPSGILYWGNRGLTSGSYNWSTSGGSSNTIDTVEQVLIQNPQVGTWTVEVFADEVNQDTHSENGSFPPDADYALVVAGVEACDADSIVLTGPSIGFVGGTLTYQYANAIANASFSMLYSLQNQGTILNGQCFDIGPTIFTADTGTTTGTGNGSWTSGAIPPKGAGKTVYVEMRVDAFGVTYDSNMLQLDIF